MNTKEKITDAAIRLFNSRGINSITIRDIGNEIGISSGNLAYHFKNKEVLLQHFYNNMYDEVDINTEFDGEDGFSKFQKMMVGITDFMTKYRFFYTDIIDIFRLCPTIKKSYASNYKQRKQIYQNIFHHFEEIGLLKTQNDDPIFDNLSHKIWFSLTFWQSQKKILPKGIKEVEAHYVLKQIWHFIVPYMTDVGIKEFQKIKE